MTTTPTTVPAPDTAQAASLYQRLRGHLATLKLHDASEALPSLVDRAQKDGMSMTATLEELLSIEVDGTEARRLAGRLRFACLPTPASLEDFDFDSEPGVDRRLIAELGTCRYLETATNVLLIGPPGVRKTHLSVGLARAAAYAGYRTYFTTAADLEARCHRAAIEGRWATRMRFHGGPTLLVIDEFGYLRLPCEAASALFQVVAQRYLKTSIVITTNRGIGEWVRSSATPPPQPRGSTDSCTAPLYSPSTEKRGEPFMTMPTRPPPSSGRASCGPGGAGTASARPTSPGVPGRTGRRGRLPRVLS